MKKIVFGILISGLMAVSCINQKQEGVVVASPDAFEQKMLQKETQVVDVRTASEYAEGHIEKATNIDVLQADFRDKVASLDKDKPIMVYCKVGGRSAKAAGILKEMGFKDVTDLEGGFTAWKEAGK
jgi:rhodanese-related sulfurtransferase